MNLRITLNNALKGDRRKERALVKHAHQLAVAYLRTRKKIHYRLFQFISGGIVDFAWDAIADLFEKEANKLVKLENWCVAQNAHELADIDLSIEFRKLVFTQVNDFTFSAYRDKDANLARIIRNLKRALTEQDVDGLIYMSQSGHIGLSEYHLDDLRLISPEVLEVKLSSRLNEIKNVVEVLKQLRSLFEYYDGKRNAVSLNVLSVVVRNLSIRVNEIENEDVDYQLFEQYELEKLLSGVILDVKARFYHSYVLKNKLSVSEFSQLMSCTKLILQSEYLNGESKKSSFYEYFTEFIEKISVQEYKDRYRVVLEYFVKTARKSFIEVLKKEIKSAERAIWKG